jgi:hypothetical protein
MNWAEFSYYDVITLAMFVGGGSSLVYHTLVEIELRLKAKYLKRGKFN